MNLKQKILWISIAIIVGMGLFPPWKGETERYRYYKKRTYADIMAGRPGGQSPSLIVSGEYGCLFNPPLRAKEIDFGRLSLQMGLVVIIAGGFILTLKKNK